MSVIDSFQGEFRFLSNFHPSTVVLDDAAYPTVEHAYQAAKTQNLDDRAIIARLPSAGSAKRFGRSLMLRRGWNELRIPVMRDLLEQKFANGLPLRASLNATAPAQLVEGNTWGDRFWGVYNGTGQNNLGRLLMEVRGDPWL